MQITINTNGRPPMPSGTQRTKTIGLNVTPAQYEQLTILSELKKENKLGTFIYKIVEKILENNSEAIQKYQEAKQHIKL